MHDQPKQIAFDRKNRPGLDFDIFPFEQILERADLDHSPLHLHRVNFYICILITSGNGQHTIDFHEHDLQRGSVLTIRKDQVHKFHKNTTNGYLILFTEEFMLSHLDVHSARNISELYNELFFPQLTELNEEELAEYVAIIELIKKEFNQTIDEHSSGIIRNLLEVLMSKLHRKRKVSAHLTMDHNYIRQFLKFQTLVEKLCVKTRQVQYYADELNVTTKTLNNITRSIIKKPCKKFIDETLMLQIKRQLINTTLNIKEIAYNSGFDEPTNMFKFFKRYTGTTPESFRSEHSSS